MASPSGMSGSFLKPETTWTRARLLARPSCSIACSSVGEAPRAFNSRATCFGDFILLITRCSQEAVFVGLFRERSVPYPVTAKSRYTELRAMSKYAGLSFQVLKERVGLHFGSGMSPDSSRHGHTFRMVWQCGCFASTEASDKPTPPDLTPWEQEMFDNAPLPQEGWTITPCPQHEQRFPDYPGAR